MQSDIISEIIEVEESATKIVESARQEANKLVNEAQMKANTQLKKIVKERRSLNNSKIDNIREENKEKIKEFEASVKASINIDYKEIDIIAEKIATKICNSSVFDK